MDQDLTHKKVGILIVATNKYITFVQPLIKSIDQFFKPTKNISYCVFTNTISDIKTDNSINFLNVEHEPWPASTLKRYDYFNQYRSVLEQFDYLFYMDADMRVVADVGDEILNDLVATLHPGFFYKKNLEFSYDRNPNCRAYIPYGKGNNYYAGGFNGGATAKFLDMTKTIVSWRQEDSIKNIIPLWHDESYLNKYLYLNTPTQILSPSYCYPESWQLPFDKKILALDKNHSYYRDL